MKEKGIHKPLLIGQLRDLLADVQATARVVGVSHEHLSDALQDTAFNDLKDSFQYHCALENECNVLVTINLKDYIHADQSGIEILTPAGFVEKYI